jgi:membrane-associated phospholipid phosphatase
MSIENSRRVAATIFVLLLTLSVAWPQPVIDVNRICCDAALGVDDLSFLGREAPRWDVPFWFLTGLFALALLQRGGDYREIIEVAKSISLRRGRYWLFLLVSGIVVAIVWRWLDAPLIARSELVNLDDQIRYANRFGGGWNPVMIVGFFLLAGVAYRARHWIRYGVAMAAAGAVAGVFVQVVKFAVGRTRPELWLGPFHHSSATSFPSGHTVGAFALAGVLIFNARSMPLRAAAALLAIGVAVSRVLAFRHWPSDVTASAAIGLLCAWSIQTASTSSAKLTLTSREQPASSIVTP